jgi:MSHA biogenesis protein MshP
MKLNNQNGFTLVQAIFILVVLALLGTYMVRLSTVQQSTSTQALLQSRAYQAARAGLEWGIVRVVGGNIAADSFTVADTGCDVAVTITASEYREGTSDIKHIYHIESIATSTGLTFSSLDYVSRTLKVTIHD